MRASGVLVCAALTVALTGTTPVVAQQPERHHAHDAQRGASGADPAPRHSSDGERGPVAPRLPSYLRGRPVQHTRASWEVVPGVSFTRFDRTDYRGRIRAQLLDIDPSAPGVRLDYVGPDEVASTEPVLSMVTGDGAVAGVNGDFFDIGDTGAPLGVGRARGHAALHGPRQGWNSAFFVGGKGRPRIGTVAVRTRIRHHPRIRVSGMNSPSVPADGVVLYTREWGLLKRHRVTDGQRKHVRMVVVRDGRVRSNRHRFPRHRQVREQVLVGRDEGARALRHLEVGDRVRTRTRLQHHPRTAITGDRFLLLDGARQVVDDKEMHPRTAVGIDRDTGHVLLLVVDGRQSSSRGYTLVELARLMRRLGAEDAVNLDGGGSSTMVGRKPGGKVKVLNSPSDGYARSVANALVVRYRG